MYSNGVSHAVSSDDYNGVLTMLKWLSYVPKVLPHVVVATILMLLWQPFLIIISVFTTHPP